MPTMARYLALIIGAVALFVGVAGAFVLRYLPPGTVFYWLLPTLLIVAGCWLVSRSWGWSLAALSFLAMALAAYLAVDRFWPRPPAVPEVGGATAPGSIEPSSLPEGAAQAVALTVPETFRRAPFIVPRRLVVPPGFAITVFAAGLGSPRMLAVGPGGHLYVSIPSEGKILVLPDADGDGAADRTVIFAEGLGRPHGLAFRGGDLYVAAAGALYRLRDGDGDLRAESREIVSRDVPGAKGHWTRSVAVGPDDRLYVSAGSSCNVCREEDPRRAAVLRFALTGGPAEIFAAGLRNSVGLAFHPRTGELWGSDNGRDWLGDDLPPEEINRIVAGGDYGWPFCYGQRVPDPDFGSRQRCENTVPPAVEMQAHSAPLGIAFGFDLDFPGAYRRMLYVAFHGSWNRTVPTGYKLVGIPFAGGRPAGPAVDIVSGWLEGLTAWGRPVAPLAGADGALYLSDDRAGAVYRLVWKGKGTKPATGEQNNGRR